MKYYTILVAASVLLLAGCLARKGRLVSHAPSSAAARVNPLASDPDAALAGARLYGHLCAQCHGEKREGTRKAPPLANATIYQAPPGSLFWTIRNGSLFRGMPSFADVPPPQRWQIVTYLKQDRTGSASRSR